MFKVKDLYFQYPHNQSQTIKGLSFEIQKGEIFGFLGPSGAGKTTTQKLLVKLLNYAQGEIHFDQKNLKEMDVLRGRLQEVHYDDAGKHRRSPDEKRAAAIAEQIHNLFIKNRDAWARLDYFKEYGKYLPGTEPTGLDVDRLIYLLSMQVKVKDYLYKARVKIQKGKTINTTLYNQYLSIEDEINSIINAKI
jgi:energy-coupling factor transporter ATP-binding protein EcfA2